MSVVAPGGCCDGAALERVHFFPRQLLTADDMESEQDYFRQKLRRHNRFLHGWGVVCGAEVKPAYDGGDPTRYSPWTVWICPGYVVGPQGDEVWIEETFAFDLAGDRRQGKAPCAPTPCPPSSIPTGTTTTTATIYLAVRYAECLTRPVRVHPVGCACDDTACDYSRLRDGYEFAALPSLPASHTRAQEEDAAWCLENITAKQENRPLGIPACPVCPDEPWVVLASIQLPAGFDTPVGAGAISYQPRRTLYSVQHLRMIQQCG